MGTLTELTAQNLAVFINANNRTILITGLTSRMTTLGKKVVVLREKVTRKDRRVQIRQQIGWVMAKKGPLINLKC